MAYPPVLQSNVSVHGRWERAPAINVEGIQGVWQGCICSYTHSVSSLFIFMYMYVYPHSHCSSCIAITNVKRNINSLALLRLSTVAKTAGSCQSMTNSRGTSFKENGNCPFCAPPPFFSHNSEAFFIWDTILAFCWLRLSICLIPVVFVCQHLSFVWFW